MPTNSTEERKEISWQITNESFEKQINQLKLKIGGLSTQNNKTTTYLVYLRAANI